MRIHDANCGAEDCEARLRIRADTPREAARALAGHGWATERKAGRVVIRCPKHAAPAKTAARHFLKFNHEYTPVERGGTRRCSTCERLRAARRWRDDADYREKHRIVARESKRRKAKEQS